MTLEEAIKHCEYKAEELRKKAEFADSEGNYRKEDCFECAKDHIKLAGWLTELKQRREKDNDTMAFWMPKKVDASHYHYYCSNCNFRSKYFKSKYCPECGKEMEV